MIEPKLEDVGRAVIYTPGGNTTRSESGVITSFNDAFVFVRYGADTHSKGTYRRNLTWATNDK